VKYMIIGLVKFVNAIEIGTNMLKYSNMCEYIYSISMYTISRYEYVSISDMYVYVYMHMNDYQI
jgi:hypothetical protein